jgi:sarcosine oxidase subunit beta
VTDGPRVVVIGAGAAGTATAAAAARLGAQVTVIDRGGVAAGSSGLSAGVFTTTYADPLEVELRAFCVEAIGRLARDAQVHVVRNGFLRLARTDRELELFSRAIEVQRAFGIDDSRVLEPREIHAVVPDLEVGDLLGALWAPSDGYMDGQGLCSANLAAAMDDGATFLRGAVAGVEPGPPHIVSTADDAVTCDVVVNAAGPWASRIGELLGCPMPILNERHQVLQAHLPQPLGYVMPTVMDYVPGGEQGLYLRHEGDTGRLLVGLHANESGLEPVDDPDGFRRAVDDDYVEEVAVRLLRRLPALAGMGLGQGWAGLYPCSPDDLPIVGPYPEQPSVIAAGGGGGVGLYLSPVIGALAAEWAVEGQATSIRDATPLLPGRFGAG